MRVECRELSERLSECSARIYIYIFGAEQILDEDDEDDDGVQKASLTLGCEIVGMQRAN